MNKKCSGIPGFDYSEALIATNKDCPGRASEIDMDDYAVGIGKPASSDTVDRFKAIAKRNSESLKRILPNEGEMKQCTAVLRYGRIQLIIDDGDDGYDEFAEALMDINRSGFMYWFGDVRDADGNERCGIIITNKPSATEADSIGEEK